MRFDSSNYGQNINLGQRWVQTNPAVSGGLGICGTTGLVLLIIGILGLTGVLSISGGAATALTVVGAILSIHLLAALACLGCLCGVAILCCPCLTAGCCLEAVGN